MVEDFVWISALAVTLLFYGSAFASQATATKEKSGKTATKAVAAAAPTEKEIADAKAKGLVWVNTSSKVYHKEGKFYGKQLSRILGFCFEGPVHCQCGCQHTKP